MEARAEGRWVDGYISKPLTEYWQKRSVNTSGQIRFTICSTVISGHLLMNSARSQLLTSICVHDWNMARSGLWSSWSGSVDRGDGMERCWRGKKWRSCWLKSVGHELANWQVTEYGARLTGRSLTDRTAYDLVAPDENRSICCYFTRRGCLLHVSAASVSIFNWLLAKLVCGLRVNLNIQLQYLAVLAPTYFPLKYP